LETIEAKILLRNLLKRIKPQDDGTCLLPGVLTDDEIEALQIATQLLEGAEAKSRTVESQTPTITPALIVTPKVPISAFGPEEPNEPASVEEPQKLEPTKPKNRIDLDLSSLSADTPPKDVRLCLDFGTAMSKATLVQDDDDSEEIHVLHLGVPGDQEEISEVMLVSSIFIDRAGMLWFGKAAVEMSLLEGGDGSRQRIDNIKRRLSEEGWNEKVDQRLNPIADLEITYGDMVLAYLMFLTWAVNSCLVKMGHPRNLSRRFAMPCLVGEKGRETVRRLKRAVGEAQVLADTFNTTLNNGIALEDFLAAVIELRKQPRDYNFVAEDITEPIGVAGSIVSWKSRVDTLMLVVDIGAGTSDLSLYRIHIDPETGNNVAMEVEGSSKGITEAGNHLDRILIELIIKKSGLTSDNPMWINERSALELRIRDYKESLFNDEYVYVTLMNGTEVEIELSEFLQHNAVVGFGSNLRKAMVDILESVDTSVIHWILANPARKLAIALTGGGAELPMVTELAKGSILVNGREIPVVRSLQFPTWLRELDENLEADYPRVAVSLGGARRRLIKQGASLRITAGDGTQAPRLGGYYQKGN
jgi:molecular chaperone HscA